MDLQHCDIIAYDLVIQWTFKLIVLFVCFTCLKDIRSLVGQTLKKESDQMANRLWCCAFVGFALAPTLRSMNTINYAYHNVTKMLHLKEVIIRMVCTKKVSACKNA